MDFMKIIFYTSNCPKCKILKAKLDEKNIEYDIFDNIDGMIKKGFTSMPMLEIDGEVKNFLESINWIKGIK